MIYTQGKGIVATAAELKGLLVFTDAESQVDFIVSKGKLVVRAGCPHTVFHIVDGWNGKEKVTDRWAWQIDAAILKRLQKIAGKNEEIFFPVGKKGHISRCRIQTIDGEDTKVIHDSSLDGHVTHQDLIPMDPEPTKPVDGGASMLSLSTTALKNLDIVAKAVASGVAEFHVPNTPDGRTYVAIDTPQRLHSGEAPRWVVELASQHLVEEEADEESPVSSGRQGKLGFDADEEG